MVAALLSGWLLLAAEAPDAGASSAGPPEIHIHGNVVMPDEVYLSVVDLPPDASADLPTASVVREQLLSFLLRAGYELAQVNVALVGHAFEVDIDEGQVEKVVFRGKLTFQTLRFKLALVLPYDVFNRPELDREIKKLQTDLKLERVWYELVPVQQVAHIGPQIEELPQIQGLQLVHARRQYELHIFFAEHEWDNGTWLDLKSGFPDGTELGAVYQGSRLFFADDRYKVQGSGGVNLRNAILDRGIYLAPSRGFGEIRYYSPALGHGLGRAFLWMQFEGTARQRPDLCLENYLHERAEGSLSLQYQPASRMTISYGGGTQWRRIFGERTPTPQPGLEAQDPCLGLGQFPGPEVKGLRTFGLLRTDLIFDTGSERWDRRHALWAEGRLYVGPRVPSDQSAQGGLVGEFTGHRPTYGEIRAQYQKVWALGWHDLWLRSKGAWLWGDVFFHDEEPLGRHLRGVFGTEYVHHAASVSGEFRFSITRDIYKVSVFNDLVVYGHLDQRACTSGAVWPPSADPANPSPCYQAISADRSFEATSHETAAIADAFGVGFHALIEGMIQVDIYYSIGVRTPPPATEAPNTVPPYVNARFDTGGAISLEKVF